jgi:hypothetical protein
MLPNASPTAVLQESQSEECGGEGSRGLVEIEFWIQTRHVSLASHAHATVVDLVVGWLPYHQRWPVGWTNFLLVCLAGSVGWSGD